MARQHFSLTLRRLVGGDVMPVHVVGIDELSVGKPNGDEVTLTGYVDDGAPAASPAPQYNFFNELMDAWREMGGLRQQVGSLLAQLGAASAQRIADQLALKQANDALNVARDDNSDLRLALDKRDTTIAQQAADLKAANQRADAAEAEIRRLRDFNVGAFLLALLALIILLATLLPLLPPITIGGQPPAPVAVAAPAQPAMIAANNNGRVASLPANQGGNSIANAGDGNFYGNAVAGDVYVNSPRIPAHMVIDLNVSGDIGLNITGDITHAWDAEQFDEFVRIITEQSDRLDQRMQQLINTLSANNAEYVRLMRLNNWPIYNKPLIVTQLPTSDGKPGLLQFMADDGSTRYLKFFDSSVTDGGFAPTIGTTYYVQNLIADGMNFVIQVQLSTNSSDAMAHP